MTKMGDSGGAGGDRLAPSWPVFGLSLLSGVIAAALTLVFSGMLSAPEERSVSQQAAAEPKPALASRVARLEGLLELHPREEAEGPLAPRALLARIELLERELELHPPEPGARPD